MGVAHDFLAARGIPGAAEAGKRGVAGRELAAVLTTVNPAGKTPAFDAVLRAVHQPGLRRLGDAALLVETLGDGRGDAGLSARARAAYLGTVRGRIVADLRKPHHWVLYGAAVFAAALYASRLSAPLLFPGVPDGVLMFLVRKAVLVAGAAAAYSAYRISAVVVPPSATAAMRRTAPVASACAAGIAMPVAAYFGTPLLFVAACLPAAYVWSGATTSTRVNAAKDRTATAPATVPRSKTV